jgi:hypothetical protein
MGEYQVFLLFPLAEVCKAAGPKGKKKREKELIPKKQ